MRVTVVDSGMGNLHSVVKALRHVGAEVTVATTREHVQDARRLVLPGVGAFPANVQALKDRGLWEPIWLYLAHGHPFLGICVGMQLLMTGSHEHGYTPGFGIIPGVVRKIVAPKVPHVGWNDITPYVHGGWTGTPLDGVAQDGTAPVYFVHSYAALALNSFMLAVGWHGDFFAAAVKRGNVMGVQFHPEKSGEVGLAILRKWVNA